MYHLYITETIIIILYYLYSYILRVFVLHHFLFPSRGRRARGLSYNYKLNQATFTDWMCFLHLTSWKKSALIQKSSAQIPKTLNQHGIAQKTKMF